MPICNVLSLAVPAIVGCVGYYLARTAKGATNVGEALAPLFVLIFAVIMAAAVGEVAAVVSLARGERLAWLAWLGVFVNGILLIPGVCALYLRLTAN